MTKKQLREIIYIANQILPFFTITALFITAAYRYGSSLSPRYVENAGELIRLSCNYLP